MPIEGSYFLFLHKWELEGRFLHEPQTLEHPGERGIFLSNQTWVHLPRQSITIWLTLDCGEGFWSYSVWCCVSRIGSSCSKDLNSQKAFGEEVLKAKWGGGLQGAWSAYGHFSDWLVVMQQGGIIFQESMSSTFWFKLVWGFPHSSVSKESASNAGDLGSIPRSGRSLGEGNGNPLQYSCLENPMDRGAWQAAVHGVTRVEHDKPPPVWALPVGGQHVVAFFPLLGVLASLKWVKNMGQYIIYCPWGGTEGPWLNDYIAII